jgi:succinate-semialdehyde dehydrogenase/glutarate-semialdehyde dehydrogenase
MNSPIIISLNPSKNYEVLGHVAITSHEQIRDTVLKARAAQPSWDSMGVEKRVALLGTVYQKFEQNKERLATIIAQEMGMPIAICLQIDIIVGLQYMRGYLDNAKAWLAPEITFENDTEIHYLFFEPKGVAGLSIPWNYPFCNFIWAVMQNLVVGNVVVFKHSEECPLTGKLLDELVQSTDLPEGVFNQVYGTGSDAGEYLMNCDIDLIWFTGSTGVGKHLYQVAARKFIPAILELGGSAPGIVFEDADLKMAIESIYFYRFLNNGQTCDGLKRLIVHRSIFNQVVQELKNIVSTKKIGPANDPSTEVGPLVSERQLLTLEDQVADALKKGAKVICGAKRPSGLQGAYYEPTILTDITFDMKVWTEEVFAPALPIVPFDTEEQAIALANDSRYGLGGYIYTQNKERALAVSARLQTGNICINGASYVIAQDPFGGYKDSGLGREHGKAGLRELCSSKLVALKK